MKKSLFYMATLCAAFSMFSCSNEASKNTDTPDDDKQAIGFRTYLDKNVKAVSTPTGSLKQDFWTLGYYDEQGGQSITGLAPNFMYKQQVNYTTSGFVYSPLKYWPSVGNVSFFAWTPYNEKKMTFTTPTTVTSTGYPVFTYQVNDTILNQEDLLVAEAMEQNGLSPTVNLQFNHALTKIGFSARIAADYSTNGLSVILKSVELTKIINKGTFNYGAYIHVADTAIWWSTPTPTPEVLSNYLPGITNSNGINLKYYEKPNTYTQVNADDQYLLVIPQNFSKSASQLVIKYDLVYNDGTPTTAFTKNVSLSETVPWKSGTYVNYAITISLNTVSFTATVNDWNNTQQNIIILP